MNASRRLMILEWQKKSLFTFWEGRFWKCQKLPSIECRFYKIAMHILMCSYWYNYIHMHSMSADFLFSSKKITKHYQFHPKQSRNFAFSSIRTECKGVQFELNWTQNNWYVIIGWLNALHNLDSITNPNFHSMSGKVKYWHSPPTGACASISLYQTSRAVRIRYWILI